MQPEQEWYRHKLAQWRALGFDTAELERLLETDFEALRRLSFNRLRGHLGPPQDAAQGSSQAAQPQGLGARPELSVLDELRAELSARPTPTEPGTAPPQAREPWRPQQAGTGLSTPAPRSESSSMAAIGTIPPEELDRLRAELKAELVREVRAALDSELRSQLPARLHPPVVDPTGLSDPSFPREGMGLGQPAAPTPRGPVAQRPGLRPSQRLHQLTRDHPVGAAQPRPGGEPAEPGGKSSTEAGFSFHAPKVLPHPSAHLQRRPVSRVSDFRPPAAPQRTSTAPSVDRQEDLPHTTDDQGEDQGGAGSAIVSEPGEFSLGPSSERHSHDRRRIPPRAEDGGDLEPPEEVGLQREEMDATEVEEELLSDPEFAARVYAGEVELEVPVEGEPLSASVAPMRKVRDRGRRRPAAPGPISRASSQGPRRAGAMVQRPQSHRRARNEADPEEPQEDDEHDEEDAEESQDSWPGPTRLRRRRGDRRGRRGTIAILSVVVVAVVLGVLLYPPLGILSWSPSVHATPSSATVGQRVTLSIDGTSVGTHPPAKVRWETGDGKIALGRGLEPVVVVYSTPGTFHPIAHLRSTDGREATATARVVVTPLSVEVPALAVGDTATEDVVARLIVSDPAGLYAGSAPVLGPYTLTNVDLNLTGSHTHRIGAAAQVLDGFLVAQQAWLEQDDHDLHIDGTVTLTLQDRSTISVAIEGSLSLALGASHDLDTGALLLSRNEADLVIDDASVMGFTLKGQSSTDTLTVYASLSDLQSQVSLRQVVEGSHTSSGGAPQHISSGGYEIQWESVGNANIATLPSVEVQVSPSSATLLALGLSEAETHLWLADGRSLPVQQTIHLSAIEGSRISTLTYRSTQRSQGGWVGGTSPLPTPDGSNTVPLLSSAFAAHGTTWPNGTWHGAWSPPMALSAAVAADPVLSDFLNATPRAILLDASYNESGGTPTWVLVVGDPSHGERRWSTIVREASGATRLVDSGEAQRTIPPTDLDNATPVATLGALEGQLVKSPTLGAGLLRGESVVDYGAVGLRLVGPAAAGTTSLCVSPTLGDTPAPLLVQFERTSADGTSNTTAAFDARSGQLRSVLEHSGGISLC